MRIDSLFVMVVVLMRLATVMFVEILVIVVSSPIVVVVLLLRLILLMLMLLLRLALMLLGLATLILLWLVLLLSRWCRGTSVGLLCWGLRSLKIFTLSRLLILLDKILKVQLLLIIVVLLVGIVGQDVIIINIIIVFVVVFLVIIFIFRLVLCWGLLGLFSWLLWGSCWLGRSSIFLGLLSRLLCCSSGLSRGSQSSEGSSLNRYCTLLGLLLLRFIFLFLIVLQVFIIVLVFVQVIFILVRLITSLCRGNIFSSIGLGLLEALLELLASDLLLIRGILLVLFFLVPVHEHARIIISLSLRFEESTKVQFSALSSAH